jgi:hypothetical protein
MMESVLSWRPETWIDYLLIYLAPGVAMAAYFLVKTQLDKPSEFAKSIMQITRKEETRLDQLKEALVLSLGVTCVIVGWPGCVVWTINNMRNEAIRQKRYEEPDFNCLPEYLVAIVNPIDAESASFIMDPLGGTPPLPFGHLNKAWADFLADMLDERDEMWSFYIPKGSECGKHRFAATTDIRGFAKVRNGKVLGEFITESD